MIVVGVDLAWTGPTGWAALETGDWEEKDLRSPVVEYGLLPRIDSRSVSDEIDRIQSAAARIADLVSTLVARFRPSIFAYEYPDWSRGSRGNRAYGADKRAAIALARSEAILAYALAHYRNGRLIRVGANEAKSKFLGSSIKDGKRKVAFFLGNLWSGQFEVRKGKMFDKTTDTLLAWDISDAMMIAMVASEGARFTDLVSEHVDRNVK